MPITKLMDLARIQADESLQMRVRISDAAVEEYAEALIDGAKFPPPVVFFDGTAYWLASGFHRYAAHQTAGRRGMTVEVREGSKRDALLFSVGENGTHGLRRTNDDKRKSVRVMLADDVWSTWTDRQIATAVGVSHTFVADMRKGPEKSAGTTKKDKVRVYDAPKPDDSAVATLPLNNRLSTDPEQVRVMESEGAPFPDRRAAPPPPDQHDDPVMVLAEENDRLRTRLALAATDGTEEEKGLMEQMLHDLRAELSAVRAERDSIATQRDAYMRDNVELKKTVGALNRKIERMRVAA